MRIGFPFRIFCVLCNRISIVLYNSKTQNYNNMGRIATEQEAKDKLKYQGTVISNIKCCTKDRAIEMKADISKLEKYKDNQLVQLSDIDKGEAKYIYFNIWGDVPYRGSTNGGGAMVFTSSVDLNVTTPNIASKFMPKEARANVVFRSPKGMCPPPYTNITIDTDLLVLSIELTDNYREFSAFDSDGVLQERQVWPLMGKIGFTEYSLDSYPPNRWDYTFNIQDNNGYTTNGNIDFDHK